MAGELGSTEPVSTAPQDHVSELRSAQPRPPRTRWRRRIGDLETMCADNPVSSSTGRPPTCAENGFRWRSPRASCNGCRAANALVPAGRSLNAESPARRGERCARSGFFRVECWTHRLLPRAAWRAAIHQASLKPLDLITPQIVTLANLVLPVAAMQASGRNPPSSKRSAERRRWQFNR